MYILHTSTPDQHTRGMHMHDFTHTHMCYAHACTCSPEKPEGWGLVTPEIWAGQGACQDGWPALGGTLDPQVCPWPTWGVSAVTRAPVFAPQCDKSLCICCWVRHCDSIPVATCTPTEGKATGPAYRHGKVTVLHGANLQSEAREGTSPSDKCRRSRVLCWETWPCTQVAKAQNPGVMEGCVCCWMRTHASSCHMCLGM